jgi:branched-subunit amino acid aminotransferase/4-amino-4-deoxychorismate lyase
MADERAGASERQKSSLACLDGELVPTERAQIPVTDEGLLRGDGVFEVARIYEGRAFALDEHLERMVLSAANLRLPIDRAAVEDDVRSLLEASSPGDGVLRVLVTRGGHRVTLIEPLPKLPESISLARVTYSPTLILDGIKSLSYAANMLATRLAVERGFDEALLVSPAGRVLEAPTSSFFWARGGELYTPPLADHVLDSITRRLIIEASAAREQETSVEDLAGAEEAFIASSLREVVAVHGIEQHSLAAPGPLTSAAAAAVRANIAATLERVSG